MMMMVMMMIIMIMMIRDEFMSIVCPKFRENPSEALAEELKTQDA